MNTKRAIPANLPIGLPPTEMYSPCGQNLRRFPPYRQMAAGVFRADSCRAVPASGTTTTYARSTVRFAFG